MKEPILDVKLSKIASDCKSASKRYAREFWTIIGWFTLMYITITSLALITAFAWDIWHDSTCTTSVIMVCVLYAYTSIMLVVHFDKLASHYFLMKVYKAAWMHYYCKASTPVDLEFEKKTRDYLRGVRHQFGQSVLEI